VDLQQLPGLQKRKMVMYGITGTLMLNSTFGLIGKATADKMTAKVIAKNSSFCFSVKN